MFVSWSSASWSSASLSIAYKLLQKALKRAADSLSSNIGSGAPNIQCLELEGALELSSDMVARASERITKLKSVKARVRARQKQEAYLDSV